ncbi:pyruvate dehydrogenase (acetyl-transferring) E1 component subunit alpha, partial [Streptomyces sp. DT9]
MAAALRERMNADPVLDPMDHFAQVYAEQTTLLREQAARLRVELDAENEQHGTDDGRAGR